MTNIAYAAVTQSGLSFERQLWMRPDIIPGLRKLTDAIHKEGAAASIQLGHCGNMSHKRICGCTPISASSGVQPLLSHDRTRYETIRDRFHGSCLR